MNEIVPVGKLEQVLIGGDLARLNESERLTYYRQMCDSLQLNPLTKPFQYIILNGKMAMYATKDCTEQLRKRDSVSVQIVAREHVEGVYVVTARATRADGRCDESIGAVSVENLKGEARANAIMKAETKAKRRVTLSICGLGMLDESEADSIPGAVVSPSDAAKEIAAEKIEKLRAEVMPQIEAAPAEVVEPAPRKATKKTTDFEMLKHFQEMKREIGEDAYYAVLNRFNFKKSDEITDRETARKVYVAMGHERARLKAESEIMATLKHAGEVIGVATLIKILGAHGAECPEDVAGMQPEAQAAALEAVNVAVKEKVTHEEN